MGRLVMHTATVHRSAIGGALLAFCLVATSAALAQTTAEAQDQAAAMAKDAIFARKIVMDTIGSNMDEIEAMAASTKPINLAEAHEHADIISVMLMAFPHLFPPATNQWKPNVERDPARDTFAAPELWNAFADFYARAANASKVAYKASRAEQEGEFKGHLVELRAACDSCHATYLKAGP
jgi:cytochrome c556